MFKASLIESHRFYSLKRKQAALILIPPFILGILVNFFHLPVYLLVIAAILYILLLWAVVSNGKSISQLLKKQTIELDENELRVFRKDGMIEEKISLQEIDSLTIKEEYSLPQETATDTIQLIMGNVEQQYITIVHKGKEKRFDFEIASHYMLNQLNKLIQTWQQRGYKIRMLNQG